MGVFVRYSYVAACHHVSFSCMHKFILCGNYYGFIFLSLQGMYNSMFAVQNSLVSYFHDLHYLFHRIKNNSHTLVVDVYLLCNFIVQVVLYQFSFLVANLRCGWWQDG
jgi:hypothetical protein